MVGRPASDCQWPWQLSSEVQSILMTDLALSRTDASIHASVVADPRSDESIGSPSR